VTLAELKPAGVHLVVVPFSERRVLLRRWASGVERFTAVDFDSSLYPLLSPESLRGCRLLLEGGSVLAALKDVYSLERGDDPIIVNSLGTLQAMARASGGQKDWSRRFFKYILYMGVACRARSPSSLFVLNSVREGGVRGLLGAGWVKMCSGAFDGTWILSEGGLSRLS
jgi:hypothetical protein